jgi:hypothetical protein
MHSYRLCLYIGRRLQTRRPRSGGRSARSTTRWPRARTVLHLVRFPLDRRRFSTIQYNILLRSAADNNDMGGSAYSASMELCRRPTLMEYSYFARCQHRGDSHCSCFGQVDLAPDAAFRR